MIDTVAGVIQSPTAIWRRQIFPTGKPTRASPKCAEVRRRNHATLRAQSTIGRYGHSAPNRALSTLSSSWSVCRSIWYTGLPWDWAQKRSTNP